MPTAAVLLGLLVAAAARAEEALVLEGKIALPGVAGRIDHMAVDLARKQLLVAELGKRHPRRRGSPGRTAAQANRRAPRAAGRRLCSENGSRGRRQRRRRLGAVFCGDDLAPAGSLSLGDDADNVRVDPRTDNVSGGLAIIDPEKRSKIGDIKLAAHPESFQLDTISGRIFVNVPDAGHIAVVDLASARQVASWTVPGLHANFPLAIDGPDGTIAVAFRNPTKLVLLDTKTGAPTQQLDTCGDADDVFFDAKRRRIYVSCGAGAIDVFQSDASGYRPPARVATSSGVRTALLAPELDQLFVAARAGLLGSDAAILVFRPQP